MIETLVSIMVLAISLTVILQLFSGGLNSVRVSSGYTLAVLHAREKMEEVLLSERLASGNLSGHFEDGYSWEAVVEHQTIEDENGRVVNQALDLFEITVDVQWLDGDKEKHYDVTTLVIAELEEEA